MQLLPTASGYVAAVASGEKKLCRNASPPLRQKHLNITILLFIVLLQRAAPWGGVYALVLSVCGVALVFAVYGVCDPCGPAQPGLWCRADLANRYPSLVVSRLIVIAIDLDEVGGGMVGTLIAVSRLYRAFTRAQVQMCARPRRPCSPPTFFTRA